MFKKLLVFAFASSLAHPMEQALQIFEHEEITLEFKKNPPKDTSSANDFLQQITFSQSNRFEIDEYAVIKNGMLSVFNLRTVSGTKVVRIIEKDETKKQYTFKIVTRKDENGIALEFKEITAGAELIGKIPNDLLKNILKSN